MTKIKNLRKLMSAMMAMVMAFYVVVPLQAAEEIAGFIEDLGVLHTISDDGMTGTTSFVNVEGVYHSLKITQRDYGYALYEFVDGILVKSAVIYNATQNKMHLTDHTSRILTTEVIDLNRFAYTTDVPSYITPEELAFITTGVIHYSAFGSAFGSRVPHQISVQSNGGTPTLLARQIQFDAGEWATYIVIAGLVISVLGFPGILASKMAAKIMASVGISVALVGTAAHFQIPRHTIVRGVRWHYEFRMLGQWNPNGTWTPNGSAALHLFAYELTNINFGGPKSWPALGGIEAFGVWGNQDFARMAFEVVFGTRTGGGNIVVDRWQ